MRERKGKKQRERERRKAGNEVGRGQGSGGGEREQERNTGKHSHKARTVSVSGEENCLKGKLELAQGIGDGDIWEGGEMGAFKWSVLRCTIDTSENL